MIPDAAAPLGAVGGERERLDVARVRDRDDHLLVGDQVLDVDVVLGRRDLRPPLVAVAVGDLLQLGLDQLEHHVLVAEQLAQLADPLHLVRVLLAQLPGLERGQLLEAQVEDRARLDLGHLEPLDQAGARRVAIARRADQRDDLVEVVERDQQALEHVHAVLEPAQLVLGAADDDLALMADVVADDLLEREEPRHVLDQRDHVHAERRLQRRVLVELVEHDLRVRVALELDHQPHAVAVRVVLDVGDLGQLLLVDEIDDLADDAAVAALLDHERQLGDDDRLAIAADLLDVGGRLHAHAAAAGLVRVADAGQAEDRAAGREVGAVDVLHQARDVDVRILDEGDRGRDRLLEVVRRDVRRHADGDAAGAVDEQVREPRRQDDRLLLGAVVVRREVDGVRVQVAQHLARDRRQPRLRVPHRGGGIVVDRAEVALAVDERVAQGEVLRHPDDRVVDRRVAVRVVLAHHVADDARGLDERAVRLQAVLVHRVQRAAVDGLQAVADVGQRAPDDDRHRVVQIGGAHLLLEPARLDVARHDRGRHRLPKVG